jgi:hypothetical protein
VNFARAREWRGSARLVAAAVTVPPLVETTGILAERHCAARTSR